MSGPGALPALLQVCNPDGSNGAVAGYAIPLRPGASRDLLSSAMTTESYGFTTLDKKGVLQLDIFNRNAVPFQLPATEVERRDMGLTEEGEARANACAYVGTLTFRGYDEDVYPTIRFFLSVAIRLAALTNGIVADPLAECYRMPETWIPPAPRNEPLDFREVARVRAEAMPDGVWVSTRGLSKFNLPEYEMYGLPEPLVSSAAVMVASAGQQSLFGIPIRVGESAFATAQKLLAVQGTRNRAAWGDRNAIELRDSDGDGAAKGVEAWSKTN